MKMTLSLMALIFASSAYASVPAGKYACENPFEDTKFDVRVDAKGAIHFVAWTDGSTHQPGDDDFSHAKLIKNGAATVMADASGPDAPQPNTVYEVSCVLK